MTRGAAFFFAVLSLTVGAAAVPPFEVPTADSAPRIDGDRQLLVAAAIGAPDGRVSRLSAIRLATRRLGEERARNAIHAFVDDALAAVRAPPWDAQAIHRAIDRSATVDGVRALVDGGAVVQVAVPVGQLRSAASVRGVPWVR